MKTEAMESASSTPATYFATLTGNKFVLPVVLFLMVLGLVLILYFYLSGTGDMCVKCMQENCPVDLLDITNPLKLCTVFQNARACKCNDPNNGGSCRAQCTEQVKGDPNQCAPNSTCFSDIIKPSDLA